MVSMRLSAGGHAPHRLVGKKKKQAEKEGGKDGALGCLPYTRYFFHRSSGTGTLFQWPTQIHGHFFTGWSSVRVQFVERVRFLNVCGTRHKSPVLIEQTPNASTSLDQHTQEDDASHVL